MQSMDQNKTCRKPSPSYISDTKSATGQPIKVPRIAISYSYLFIYLFILIVQFNFTKGDVQWAAVQTEGRWSNKQTHFNKIEGIQLIDFITINKNFKIIII